MVAITTMAMSSPRPSAIVTAGARPSGRRTPPLCSLPRSQLRQVVTAHPPVEPGQLLTVVERTPCGKHRSLGETTAGSDVCGPPLGPCRVPVDDGAGHRRLGPSAAIRSVWASCTRRRSPTGAAGGSGTTDNLRRPRPGAPTSGGDGAGRGARPMPPACRGVPLVATRPPRVPLGPGPPGNAPAACRLPPPARCASACRGSGRPHRSSR